MPNWQIYLSTFDFPNAAAGTGTFGTAFRSTCNGVVNGIRFWKHASDSGSHTALLYSSGSPGSLLASQAFSGETSTGWQYQAFGSPVAITAGVTYIAAFFHSNASNYEKYTSAPAVDNFVAGPLKVDATMGRTFAGGLSYPSTSDANSYADLVFDDQGNFSFPSFVKSGYGRPAVVGAIRALNLSGLGGNAGDAQIRNLMGGVRKDTIEGSPNTPCLAIDIPNSWRFRWGVKAGTRTLRVSAKQVASIAGFRPSIIVKADSTLGVNADVIATAAVSSGWVTIGPLTVNPSSDGVLWVELWNNDTNNFNSPAFFDHITAT